jgi:hypothetical protein
VRVLRTTLGLACVAVACCATATATATAQADDRAVRPLSAAGPLGDERLSDELRTSRYGGAVAPAAVRRLPSATAPRITRLRFLTEDDSLEVYPVLESHVDAGGQTWLHIRLPMRPNGRSGWVHENDLTPLKAVRTMLRVDRGTLRATLYRSGRRIWSSRVGVGKRSTPTPAGHFWIRSRLRGLRSDPAYGPYAFGTAAYATVTDWPAGGVVGIHGTNQPGLIPGRPSHGCIRVPNAAIIRLWRLMPVGTPVVIA